MDEGLVLALLFLGMLGVFVQLTIMFETVVLSLTDPDRDADVLNRLPPRGNTLRTVRRWWRPRDWRRP